MQSMVTNGGPHPADKWAAVTTNEILDLIKIDPESQSPAAVEARLAKEDLRSKLLRFFTDHHDRVQKHEREQDRGPAHDLDPKQHVDASAKGLDALFAASPFAAAFNSPVLVVGDMTAKQLIHRIVGQHSANVMHIERRYHADRQQKVD